VFMDSENHFHLLDNFVAVRPGEPYRILPFGPIVRNGKRRMITPEFAAKFRLPHFHPPIKLGSHDDTTPSGGSILALEVREDGLYAVNELTEKGAAAMDAGDYRYHSPEIIWEGTGIEDATTGEITEGPLIVGDALIHTPALGEKAALYVCEILEREVNPMGDELENVSVPKTIWEKFSAWVEKISAPPEPEPTPPVVELDQLTALTSEVEQLRAEKVEREKAEAAAALKVSIIGDLQSERFGSMYVELKTAEEAAGMLQGMTPEQREWCMRSFAAQIAQINEAALLAEKGTTGADGDANVHPLEALNSRVMAVQAEKKLNYADAFKVVSVETPELVSAAYPNGGIS
jgi:hypothetical protein